MERKELRDCFAHACTRTGIRFTDFARKVGLQGFLLDVDVDIPVRQLVAAALEQLCAPGEGTNGVVMIAVLYLLDSRSTGPELDERSELERLADLNRTIERPGTFDDYLAWHDRWFEVID